MTTRFEGQTAQLIAGATTNATSDSFTLPPAVVSRVMSADIKGTGSVSATVTFQGTIDGVNWFTDGSAITLSGTTTANGSTTSTTPWAMIRAVITSISGTGAAINAWAAR
jgi:hypothetical protein